MKKICPKCSPGVLIQEDENYCWKCGSALFPYNNNCKECGKEFNLGDSFCTSCGKEIDK